MTTSIGAIRSQLTTVIEAATPTNAPINELFRYVPERAQMLTEWVEENCGSACFRRFDIRRVGPAEELADHGTEIQRNESLMITIAYPRLPGLYGDSLDDMEDTIRNDARQLRDICLSTSTLISGWSAVTDISIDEPNRDDSDVWLQTITLTANYCEAQTLT